MTRSTTPTTDKTRTAAGPATVPDMAAASHDAPDDDALATMAKAIGHPARVSIVRLLSQRDACITGELVAELPLAQSTVSEHLRILREAGLIQGEIEGPRTRYCLNQQGMAALRAGVASL